MSRKQRIIVSITGIVLVSLILIGLTYAYFLTKIKGNSNNKSISVTTANLELTYGDNSAEILGKDLVLEPSDTEIGTKTFTVTNNGNSKTNYVVVIEDVSITKGETTTTFESNDFRYTLTCTKKDGSTCDGVNTQTLFPINGGILVGNNIDVSDVQTYTFKMWYIDTGIDQSNDMGKTIQAKLNITNIESINPYSSNKNSLAYNIIENARTKANGTELLATPKTKPAEGNSRYITGIFEDLTINIENLCAGYSGWGIGNTVSDAELGSSTASSYEEAVGKFVYDRCDGTSLGYLISYDASTSTLKFGTAKYDDETTLSITIDDYGSSYYYRGNVVNNYVNFANMCWRIVRIAGDGSVKLILEDQDNTCKSSDGNWNIPTITGGTKKTGYYGYTEYDPDTLTASDGTKNSRSIEMINYLKGETKNNESMAYAFKNFQTGPLASYLDKLKVGDWCLNDIAYATNNDNTTPLTSTEILDKQIKGTKFYYDSYVRLIGKTKTEPTLKCNGTNMTKFSDNTDMYVGTLTADEIVHAGVKATSFGDETLYSNRNFYLINNYQKSNNLSFWALTFATNSVMSVSSESGVLSMSEQYEPHSTTSFRPSISLKPSTQITNGDGTIVNPYVIE